MKIEVGIKLVCWSENISADCAAYGKTFLEDPSFPWHWLKCNDMGTKLLVKMLLPIPPDNYISFKWHVKLCSRVMEKLVC